ncbi:MAG: class I SAM-dependent methyltransferase [Alphaproteobacteria bacterium]|nr:class I SAM-dependent methyltransferase [Alphaproteobacteria bacterium]
MRNNSSHAMFPSATHDEQALQNYIKSLRVHSTRGFHTGNKSLLKSKIEPELRRKSGNRMPSRKDVREALSKEEHNKWWSAMVRTTQEMLYDSVGPSIERQLPALVTKAKKLRGKRGTLTLDDRIATPPYLAAVDMHCKPGSYQQQLSDDDVFPGAEFDRTFRLYSMGGLGPNLDDGGRTLINWVKAKFPNLKPKRILDLGCTVGHSTLPYCDAFGKNVEVHAIDTAAPCLRYGHARAVAMGKEVHFRQADAEDLPFADGHFDLIVSHALMHETSTKAIRGIYKEAYRLLAPGGVMAHIDGITPHNLYEKYYSEWMSHYNNEPYLGTVQDEDFDGILAQAGFAKAKSFVDQTEPNLKPRAQDDKPVVTYIVVAGQK